MADAEQRYALADLFGTGLQEMIRYVPHCVRLGVQVVHAGPNEGTLRLPYREELVGDPTRGVVFGGVITTLLDHAGGLSVFCSLPELKTIATLDLRIDYLRAAEPRRDLFGHARCYKLTRHVAFVRGCAYEESADDPFATCQAAFMVGASSSESVFGRAMRERMGESE